MDLFLLLAQDHNVPFTRPKNRTETDTSPAITCIRCKRPQTNAEEVKNCDKCQTAYCSTDCLKADKKKHQKYYRHRTEGGSDPSPTNPNNTGLVALTNLPFTRLDLGMYLHHRPRRDVFRLLLDCYRLRVDDDIKFDNIKAPDSLHAGFREFLDLAKQRQNLLPTWWDEAAATQCQAFGTRGVAGWYTLERRVSKREVNEHYNSSHMAVQLRLLGEVVYQRGPGGQDGTDVLRRMVRQERDGGFATFHSLT